MFRLLMLFILIGHVVEVESKSRTVVITGATGEIGGAAALSLASNYDLILTGRNIEKLQKMQQEFSFANPSLLYDVCVLDYSSKDSMDQFKEYLYQKNISIAGFVLIGPRPSFYGKHLLQDQEIWHQVFQETFIGPFASLQVAIPYLVDKSSVVVISGITSEQIYPFSGASCVIRSMVSTYTKALSHDLVLEGKKVRYNAISPGVVLTDYHKKRIAKVAEENGLSYEEQMKFDVAEIPLGRHATAEDLAKIISFLISEESEGLNGVNLRFDGGWSTAF